MNKDTAERIKRQKQEVLSLGRNPKDYRYDLDTKNPYRIEHTRFGSSAYILVNDGEQGKEAVVDLDVFYTKRCYSFHWTRLSSDPTKDYPHTNTYDCTGKKINLSLHALVMGTEDGKVIDHINGDHYDCRSWNLRRGTIAQNNQNRHPRHKVIRATRKVKSTDAHYVPLFNC
jgi:hypothetical protein